MSDIQFVLMDMQADIVSAWKDAFEQQCSKVIRERFTMVKTALSEIGEVGHPKFDCIVSPANSYGRLDGSFDAYISIELGPKDDEYAITHICQTALYERWKGYCPAGNCLIVPLEGTICPTNRFDCGFIALCPTMRVPESVRWDKEVVYECMWSLLNALDHYNQEVRSRGQGREIKKVLMTGLATGVGRISPATCAMQMAVAVKHYHEALENKEKWSRLEWPEIYQLTNESRDPPSDKSGFTRRVY